VHNFFWYINIQKLITFSGNFQLKYYNIPVTSRKVGVSVPDEANGFSFQFTTSPLSLSSLCRKCEFLDVAHYGLPRPVIEIALFFTLFITAKAGQSGNEIDLYADDVEFESRPEHLLCWLRDFMILLSLSIDISEYNLC
jgi:hypothetical protein